jgi:hypothetical protein
LGRHPIEDLLQLHDPLRLPRARTRCGLGAAEAIDLRPQHPLFFGVARGVVAVPLDRERQLRLEITDAVRQRAEDLAELLEVDGFRGGGRGGRGRIW